MAITFRDEKGAPLTHEELDANFRSFFFTASYGANQLLLQRKDGTSLTVPIGGEAFADFQANGGSIGDVYIANSEITGSRMIINLFSGSFYDKIKGPASDGGGLNSDEWYITFNPQASANYYVHFGSNFAISSSGFMYASGAVIEGEITASAGLIGGFNITPDAIHGPTFLGVPSFYISGSASTSGYFISSSAFNVKGNGEITGSDVLFNGGKIAGWDITNTQIRKSTNIILDASDESISINNSTFGTNGIQLQYNGGTPRFYVGDGSDSYVRYDGNDVAVSTRLLEISASNIEISSTQASMSLGDGNIKLLGGSSTIEVGSNNKVSITGGATDAFVVAGSKTGFDQPSTAGLIFGMDATVPTLDLTKDASNYFRFNTNDGVDIRTDTFKLDTTYFDIDTSTQRLNIFDTASAEIIRLGEISDDASDLYGIKIFDGSGTGSAQTIAMFGQQGNKIGGWEVTDSQIRSIPASGFGGAYAEDETGLIIHSSGRIESSNFATNVKGWRIDTLGNGSAEFENMRIRGTLKTTVFEKESVNVVGGQLMVANATTIQPLRSEAGTIIAGSSSYADTDVTFSVANVSGFEVGEILKAKTVDDTGFSVEYMYVSGSKRYSQDATLVYNTGSIDPDGLAGELHVQRAYGGIVAVSSSVTTLAEDLDDIETDVTVASTASLSVQDIIKINDERFKITSISSTGNTLTVIRDYHDTVVDSHTNGATVYLIDTDKEFLAGLVSTAQPYNEGQVLVSTGVYNPEKDISSGYILMNANPRDVSTPYMDIVERTGSGVYDLQLRTRLGDLSGLSSGYLYGDDEPGFGLYTENGYFKGAITAQTGSIAGILHVATVQGGLETGQKISIGREVQGSNDGIYVNNNNYWYTDGAWKVGGQNNYITLDNYTDGNLTIRTETFTLDTDNFIISSSLNSGTLKAGANADIMTSTAETGIYMDGTGKFRVGTGTSGNNYIYWDGSTLNIKGSVDITGGTGATEAYVNTTATASISSSNAYTNESTASLSGSVAQVTDTLDGKIFTDSTGRAVKAPTASTTGLYMASTHLGFYESGKWKTYMDNQGDFFLTGSAGNKLAWDSSAGILEIKGAITITGGNAATQDYVTGSVNTLSGSIATSLSASNAALSDSIANNSSSLAQDLSDLDAVASGKASIFRQATAPSTSDRTVGDLWIDSDDQNKLYLWNGSQWTVSSDGTYDQAALINSTSASLSSSIALDIFTDSSGKLVKAPTTSAAGLYLGDTNLGFYSGSSWKTYMANNGNFYLTGSDSNYLAWDGTSLTIAGSINITGGNAVTQANLNTATGSMEDYADSAASTAETNANTYTNSATSSLSGSLASDISASNAELSSSIASVSGDLNNVSASQALVNQGLSGVLDGKNSIFRQAAAPTATAEGDIWIETDQGNRVRVWTGTQWLVSSDTTYDQSGLINNASNSLAADIFTDSSGKIQKTATLTGEGLFMDQTNLGYYSGSSWKTYMSNNGNFYLTGSDTNYLAWDGTSLTISGNINVLGGNAVTQTELDTATGSLQSDINSATASLSSSISPSIATAQQTATNASGTATQAAQAAASASAAANTAVTRSVDASGKITFSPTPSGTGLFMNADKLGYYDSSAWKTYMSSSGAFFLAGSGNSGLSWDGTDLSIDGTVVARDGSIGGIELAAQSMYIGTGTYDNANTPFFVSSSGKFSLGDKFVWDGTNLTVEGSITITNATYATQADLDSATGSLEDYADSASSTAVSGVTGSIEAAQSTANAATGAAADVQSNLNTATGSLQSYADTAAGSAAAAASSSAIDYTTNNYVSQGTTSSLVNPSSYAFGAGSGAFDLATATAAAGLNLTSQYLGYHDGTSFKTYMDSSGNFYLTGDGTDQLTWDGTNLRIGNPGVGPTITYQFSGSLNENVFDSSITTITTVTSPVLGVKMHNNADAWDEGFHTKAVFDRQDGPIFEFDIVVGPINTRAMFGLYEENPASYSYTQMSHAIYFDADADIHIYEEGNSRATIATDDWTADNDYSENIQYRLRIQPLAAGARYEIFKNGDYTTPAYTYDTESDNVTERYLRPGAAIFESDSAAGFIIQGMAAGARLGMATKISGNTIQTGKIQSNNWNAPDAGEEFADAGTEIDLDAGKITSKQFLIDENGNAKFKGTMQIGGTDLTEANTLNSNTTATDVGLGNVDNVSNSDIQASASAAANAADKTDGSVGGWTIHSDKIFTGTDENVAGFTSTAGRLIISSSGAIHAHKFYVDKAGNAAFKGDITGASGTFSGTVTVGGTTLTTSNTLNSNTTATDVGLGNVDNVSNSQIQATASAAANSADKTAGTVGGWTIHSDKIFTGTDENVSGYTSAAGRLIISSSGAIHAHKFYMDKAGNAAFKGDITGASGTFSGTVQVGGTNLTSANTINTIDEQSSDAVNYNPNFKIVAGDGRPAGVRTVYGEDDTSHISYYGSSNDGVAQLAANGDNTVGAGFTAFSVDQGAQYKVILRLAHSAASSTGLYIRVGETSAELADGNTHVCYPTQSESPAIPAGQGGEVGVQFGTSYSTSGNNLTGIKINGVDASSLENIAASTTYQDYEFIYTPPDGVKYASVYVLNWTGAGYSTTRFKKVHVTQITENKVKGSVGGWTIESDAIYTGTKTSAGFASSGVTLHSNGGLYSQKFFISSSGAAVFGGVVNASAGITGSLIRGATVEGGSMIGAELIGGTIYSPDSSNPTFTVANGAMTASNAQITGEITATGGQIGDWVIDSATGVLRDSDSEVVFNPDPAEIQMFNNGDKKVIIAPTSDLTSTAGGSTSISVSDATGVEPSATSTNYYTPVYNSANGTLGGATFTPSSAGDYQITLTVPSFAIFGPSGNQTVSVSAPGYEAVSEGQTHGLIRSNIAKYHVASIILEACRTSDNAVIGSYTLGSATAQSGRSSYTYYISSGSQEESDDPFLQGISSVVGTTEIELHDGSIKLAQDIVEGDSIKVWNWKDDKNEFTSETITQVRTRGTQQYYQVDTENHSIKVSDDHGFWIENGDQILVTQLIPGESYIYVKEGSTIKQELVTECKIVHEDINVYTFKVPNHKNYISDGIISHNPVATVYSWITATAPAISATNVSYSGGNQTINFNISQATPLKFRYKVRFGAKAGQNFAVSSNNTVTSTTTHTTTQGFSSDPTYDTSLSIAVPSNFVELKAGGIQIVSDAAQYVKMPRLAQGSAATSTILEAKGGTTVTDALRPSDNGSHNLGGLYNRWNIVFSEAGNFSGGVTTGNLTVNGYITATGNITAFYSSDRRLKDNIITLESPLEKVLKLRGTRFDWKEGNEDIHPNKGNDIGFIAQEVQEVLPEVVGQMEGGYYGVQYEKLTPVLVEAIKELTKKVEELERKLQDKNN